METGLYIYEQVPWSPPIWPLDLLYGVKLQPPGLGNFLFVYYLWGAGPHQLISESPKKIIHPFHLLHPFQNHMVHKVKPSSHESLVQSAPTTAPPSSSANGCKAWFPSDTEHCSPPTTSHVQSDSVSELCQVGFVTCAQVLRLVQFPRPWLYCSKSFKRQIPMTNLWFDLKHTAAARVDTLLTTQISSKT